MTKLKTLTNLKNLCVTKITYVTNLKLKKLMCDQNNLND